MLLALSQNVLTCKKVLVSHSLNVIIDSEKVLPILLYSSSLWIRLFFKIYYYLVFSFFTWNFVPAKNFVPKAITPSLPPHVTLLCLFSRWNYTWVGFHLENGFVTFNLWLTVLPSMYGFWCFLFVSKEPFSPWCLFVLLNEIGVLLQLYISVVQLLKLKRHRLIAFSKWIIFKAWECFSRSVFK